MLSVHEEFFIFTNEIVAQVTIKWNCSKTETEAVCFGTTTILETKTARRLLTLSRQYSSHY